MTRQIGVLLILLIFGPIGFAESPEEALEAHNRQNFSGWDGVVFMCSYDEDRKILAEICQRGRTEVDLLATSAKIKLVVAPPNEFANATLRASADNLVVLVYELKASDPLGAIYGDLSYREIFFNAVEKGGDQDHPRSGDLYLWLNHFIASGVTASSVSQIGDAAEPLLQQAITMYLKYNESKP